MKSKFFLTLVLVLFLASLVSTITGFSSKKMDVSYGGSASVSVRYRCPDSDGYHERTINVTTPCDEHSASSAKSALKSNIYNLMRTDEEYSSAISYDIEECD